MPAHGDRGNGLRRGAALPEEGAPLGATRCTRTCPSCYKTIVDRPEDANSQFIAYPYTPAASTSAPRIVLGKWRGRPRWRRRRVTARMRPPTRRRMLLLLLPRQLRARPRRVGAEAAGLQPRRGGGGDANKYDDHHDNARRSRGGLGFVPCVLLSARASRGGSRDRRAQGVGPGGGGGGGGHRQGRGPHLAGAGRRRAVEVGRRRVRRRGHVSPRPESPAARAQGGGGRGRPRGVPRAVLGQDKHPSTPNREVRGTWSVSFSATALRCTLSFFSPFLRFSFI